MTQPKKCLTTWTEAGWIWWFTGQPCPGHPSFGQIQGQMGTDFRWCSHGSRFQMVLRWEQISDGAHMGSRRKYSTHHHHPWPETGRVPARAAKSPSPMTRDRASASPCSKICFYFDINRISSVLEKDSAESKGPRGEENVINPFIEDVIGFLWVPIRGKWLQLESMEEDWKVMQTACDQTHSLLLSPAQQCLNAITET